MERVKKYGFTQAELDAHKVDDAGFHGQAFKEKNKTESANYAEEYIRNFLTHEPIPGITKEDEYYKKLLPQITVDDINAIGKKLDKNENQFIALTGPGSRIRKDFAN